MPEVDVNLKILTVGAVVVALGFALQATGAEGVSGDQAQELVKKGAALVDVRTREEFADGHIQGAVNIPLSDLSARLAEIGPKTRPVVVYCFSGGRSRRAAQLLREAGFAQVSDLGAMSRWPSKKS
jgi:phage shock protein E